MWSELRVVEATLDCSPPFSFYFDLIGSISAVESTNKVPLHRLCTLARKRGATFVILESALTRADVRAEIDDLDRSHGGGGAAEAVTVSFLTCQHTPEDIELVPAAEFIGQATVINYRPPASAEFAHSYVYEAIFPPPGPVQTGDASSDYLSRYIAAEREFSCVVRGKTFLVRGIYYCQQNTSTHACAHACLRMAITSQANRDVFSAAYINKTLGIEPPCDGLQLGQIVDVLRHQGFDADVIDCSRLDKENYVSALASVIESGDQALLVFKTGVRSQSVGGPQDHVVHVFGHARRADEWHPQAIPAYAGPGSARYLHASSWTDHFLIHDDNLGPYYTLSSHALEFDPDVAAHWIVAIRKERTATTPHGAEALAPVVLSNVLPVVASVGHGRWFNYLTRSTGRLVVRTILMERETYLSHLRQAVGHDGTVATSAELEALAALPRRFWTVEFTLPALFTGNRAKLGEVLISSDSAPVDPMEAVLAIRAPSLLILRDEGGTLRHGSCSLTSHTPIFSMERP